MSEPIRDPMRRQLTSGRRITPAALLPGEPRPSTETSIPGHLCEVCLDARSCTSSLRLIPAPPKSGTMLPYHTIVRGHYHDSAPC